MRLPVSMRKKITALIECSSAQADICFVVRCSTVKVMVFNLRMLNCSKNLTESAIFQLETCLFWLSRSIVLIQNRIWSHVSLLHFFNYKCAAWPHNLNQSRARTSIFHHINRKLFCFDWQVSEKILCYYTHRNEPRLKVALPSCERKRFHIVCANAQTDGCFCLLLPRLYNLPYFFDKISDL